MQETDKRRSRRQFLIGAALFGAAYAGLRWWNSRPGPLEYQAFDGLPGFRRVAGGEVSGATLDPFIGMSPAKTPVTPIPMDQLCDALFAQGRGPGVPVAFFTDYFCPYCRVMTQMLGESAAAGDIALTVHQFPILTDASDVAARAALAAAEQGAYQAFDSRLMRSKFVPDAGYLTALAESAGVDPQRLLRDMEGGAVDRQLSRSQAVGARFGFYVTPSLVIGRTVVVGALTRVQLSQLVAAEAADPGTAC